MWRELIFLRDIHVISVSLRMFMAVICGGIIGIEREYKRRPAGFRTHILICLGASMTTLCSQYLVDMGYYTDPARLGAQVIAGIGFIGAGTIIVTRGQRIKGLTTAAGLWASAIIGLTIGAGFYEVGILATVLILLAELVFSKLEYRLLRKTPEVNLYVTYTAQSAMDGTLQLYHEHNVKILNLQIARSDMSPEKSNVAIFTLRLGRKNSIETIMSKTLLVEGVVSADQV